MNKKHKEKKRYLIRFILLYPFLKSMTKTASYQWIKIKAKKKKIERKKIRLLITSELVYPIPESLSDKDRTLD